MDAFLGFVGAVVLATLGFTWSINAQMHRLARAVDHVRGSARAVGAQTEGLTRTVVYVLFGMTEAGIIPVSQLRTVLTSFNGAFSNAVAAELIAGNPLTPDEAVRLERYRAEVMQQGRLLSGDEAADLGALLAKLVREKPTNPEVWQMDFLGRLLAHIADKRA